MSSKVCKMLCSFKGRHNFVQGYLLSVGFSKAFIPYTRMKRKVGKSGYSFGQKLKMVIDFLVASSLPIRFMSCLGAVFSTCGVVYSLLIAYAWFMHQTPFSGWAPLMVITMMIGGILMIMLGVIGEYIWRIYDNLRDFPLYIIEVNVEVRREPEIDNITSRATEESPLTVCPASSSRRYHSPNNASHLLDLRRIDIPIEGHRERRLSQCLRYW